MENHKMTWLAHTAERDDDPPPFVKEHKVAIGKRLSASFERWMEIYEKHLADFAQETDGVPTKEHVRRAEELADREMRMA